jgi:hypothetical protein
MGRTSVSNAARKKFSHTRKSRLETRSAIVSQNANRVCGDEQPKLPTILILQFL